MQEDLLIVLLCELGERILAMRELLAEPSVTTKPRARAVAILLTEGLDAVEDRLQSDVLDPRRDSTFAVDRTHTHTESLAVSALDDCGRALRVLHGYVSLLDLRWGAAAVDIFLRKLREDAGDLPHPAVVLSDDYASIDDDVAARLRAGLDAAGVPVGKNSATGTRGATAEPVIALPRLEAGNPLAWPLLLPALVRLHAQHADRGSSRDRSSGAKYNAATRDLDRDRAGAVRLGGPAAFAALAAHALFMAPVEQPIWPALAAAADACIDIDTDGRGLTQEYAGETVAERISSLPGAVAFFTELTKTRDEMLGHLGHDIAQPVDGHPTAALSALNLNLPEPALPTAEEAAILVRKLREGTPINGIEPRLPDDFVERLGAVHDPSSLYALLEPLNEQPASLVAILGAGWLYKISHGYPLFRELLREQWSLRGALEAYRPHMVERNELLLQSIEAAHVQGIFVQGRLDE